MMHANMPVLTNDQLAGEKERVDEIQKKLGAEVNPAIMYVPLIDFFSSIFSLNLYLLCFKSSN